MKFDTDEGPIWINPRAVVAVRPHDTEPRVIIFLMGMGGQVPVALSAEEVVEMLSPPKD